MAKSQNNVVTHGLSGKIGNLLVFRQQGGKTIVSSKPKTSGKTSKKQAGQRRKFQYGVIYAQQAMANPGTKEVYEALSKGKRPFNVAVADFLNAPSIEQVDLSAYTGRSDDVIRIRVTDDFKVKEVRVNITNADGSLVEEGNAVSDVIGYEWQYTATQANENLNGDKIVISVSDIPGNITEKEHPISD